MSVDERQAVQTISSPDERGWTDPGHARKKLLFVTRIYEFGGAERHLIDLIRRLREPAWQLSILCIGTDCYSERLNPDLDVRVIRRDSMPDSVWGWFQVFWADKPDVAVFIYSWNGIFPWIASVGAWMAGVPKRFSIQHLVLEGSAKPGLVRLMVRRILGRVKERIAANLFCETICVSNELANSLVREFGFPAKKMKMIHNGVSLAEFAPSGGGVGIRANLGLRADEFVLVCAARLSEQKGIDILLQAVARVLRDGVDCKCIIVGDGPLRQQLLKQAQDLGLSGRVFFEGFREDIRPFLHAASAFVLTSHREGLPLAILEAMACGLPCIVTDVGGNAEAVTHRVEGLVVSPGSVAAVADAIMYLVTHPNERAQMAVMARVRACDEFDIERSMANIKHVILH